MKQSKPTNHVTARQDAMFGPLDNTDKLPVLDNETLEQIEAAYPPRTKRRNESNDEHLIYAGKVELIEELRHRSDNHFAAIQSASVDDVDDDASLNLEGAEKAS